MYLGKYLKQFKIFIFYNFPIVLKFYIINITWKYFKKSPYAIQNPPSWNASESSSRLIVSDTLAHLVSSGCQAPIHFIGLGPEQFLTRII